MTDTLDTFLDALEGIATAWRTRHRLDGATVANAQRRAEELESSENRAAAGAAVDAWRVLDALEQERLGVAWDLRELLGQFLADPKAGPNRMLAGVRAARVERLLGSPHRAAALLESVKRTPEASYEILAEFSVEEGLVREALRPSPELLTTARILWRTFEEMKPAPELAWTASELGYSIACWELRRGRAAEASQWADRLITEGYRPSPAARAELWPLVGGQSIPSVSTEQPHQTCWGLALGFLGSLRAGLEPAVLDSQAEALLGFWQEPPKSPAAFLVQTITQRGADARKLPGEFLWNTVACLVQYGPHRFGHRRFDDLPAAAQTEFWERLDEWAMRMTAALLGLGRGATGGQAMPVPPSRGANDG